MRIQIRNCVTDPRFKQLRRNGSPVFKPSILGSSLVPGSVRIVESSLFESPDVTYLRSLVESGSCTAIEVGVGDLDFSKWLATFPAAVEPPPEEEEEEEEDIAVVEPAAEPEELSEELLAETPQVEDLPEEATEDLEGYTQNQLSEMRNADLREIILNFDANASVANKSKKRLISLLLELQENG